WKEFSGSRKTASGEDFVYRETDFGPVVGDLSPRADQSACLVLRSPVYDVKTVYSLLDAPFAASFEQSVLSASSHSGYPRIFFIHSGKRGVVLPAGRLPQRPVRGIFFQDHNYIPPESDLSALRRYYDNRAALSSSVFKPEEYPSIAGYIPYSYDTGTEEISSLLTGDFSRDSRIKALSNTKSSSSGRISAGFNRLLEDIPVTSAKLSRIYFSDWNSSLSKDSRAPLIYYQLYTSIIEETFSDELGSDWRQIAESPWLISEKFEALLNKGDSRAFDNITTSDEVENFDAVFSRSFLKGMRILHRVYGPESDSWIWSRVNASSLRIPVLHKDLLSGYAGSDGEKPFEYAAAVAPASQPGTFSVYGRGSISILENNGVFLTSNFSASVHPRSEFSGSSPRESETAELNSYAKIYESRIHPAQPAVP
ncbi:MAG: penicillin acylase family protein, partial [Spirochaetota bacterium]